MVKSLCSVVEDRTVALADDLLESILLVLGIFDESIEFVDVTGMVFAMVVL
ncbi:hypothetical protein D1872_312550 [compost metagenome]